MFARIVGLAACLSAAGCVATAEEAMPVADVAASRYYPDRAERGNSADFLAACKDWDEWDKPAPPFQIFGNTFYVGTCGISAILVVGEEGHVLIDSGTDTGADVVLANIRALGLDPRDVRYLLHSHEHFDHVGGHAKISAATGATVIVSPEAVQVFVNGEAHPDDPQAGMHDAFAPVGKVREIGDDETVKLGDLELTAHLTPGHSPGAMSWTWWACSLPGDPPVCRRVAYVDSLSPISADAYRFTEHSEAVAAFRTSIDTVRALPCDLLLTPHPSASDMLVRLREGGLLGQGQCAAYADSIAKRLDARLAEEAGE
ncbi:subclass B3 metallo-beta-lactamase [Erythrobacter litoralis]|uniref:subclass B3 metallo-beta-lactamase n=1 Tax=Erythrobacter litoralis TaxID=39960 RepID=UPI0024355E59|nr:subclass B3 metallo-beta-lactamase [Erythrobacter litoralis]MDG6078328.1 subclass B3 metallo-beta-lactamase [Erythrobacter litoralis]